MYTKSTIAMDAPRPTRMIFRKGLCLKSTLEKCQYDPISNVYFREKEQTLVNNQAIALPKIDEEDDDSLEDFKSPVKKVEKKVKKVFPHPKTFKTYSYPDGCSCTQEMFVHAYMNSTAGAMYQSEDEFEIFRTDEKQRAAFLLRKAKYRNAATTTSAASPTEKPLSIIETATSSSVQPALVDIKSGTGSEENAGNPAAKTVFDFLPSHRDEISKYAGNTKNSLRTELKKMKINNVIIADSDLSEDEVPATQAVSSRKLKFHTENSSNQSVELKISEDLKDSVNAVSPTAEPIVVKEKTASQIRVSIPLSILNVAQLTGTEKSNDKQEMVTLLEDTKSHKEKMDINAISSPSLQCVNIHSTDKANLSRNLLLEPSMVQSGWRVEKMNTTYITPSRKNVKRYYCQKSRFSCIRSLRWKGKICKRKRFIDLHFSGMQKTKN